jgi:hypothetical protein
MSTTNTPPNSSLPLKDWLSIIASFLSLATMIFNLISNSPLYIFLIALIIFIISAAYYLFRLYKNGNYKPLWKLFAVFYVLSVSFALGGSWYYYTQYDPNGFPIERMKYHVYPYEGPENTAEAGSVYLAVSNSYQAFRVVTSYDMEYDVPDVDASWAGFSILFFQPIDLSKYKSIQLKIKYGDPDALVRLVLKDGAGNDADVMLDSKFFTSEKTDLQTITVPLDLFQRITLNNVREFVIDANSYFITGAHEVRISEIHFVK